MKGTKLDERKRRRTNGNEVGRKELKVIDLLLFAGIESTGTMFQTINNLLIIGNFTTSV